MIFAHFTHDFTLFMSPWRFMVISGTFGDFKVFTLRTRLRHFNRCQSPSNRARLPQETRELERYSDSSKTHFKKESKPFNSHSGEWGLAREKERHFSTLKAPNHVRKGKQPSIRANGRSFGRMMGNFGRMGYWLQVWCKNVLATPNVPYFSWIWYHSGEPLPHSAEWELLTAYFCFFAN